MYLYHVTMKENLPSIKKKGLSLEYFLKNSMYEDMTSGSGIYLSRYINGNNLPSHMSGKELISLKIHLNSLDLDLIHPDDGIYWAFHNEAILTEDDIEEVMFYFDIDDEETAEEKLEEINDLTDPELIPAFKPLWRKYLEKEGEIVYRNNIPFNLIEEVIEI